ncbi:hypothetical protein HDU67_000130 [Dinochytrium kinnereticum]|nr:hypothetical protein HDU67_000130 [Dinochytrium kinnereticum]
MFLHYLFQGSSFNLVTGWIHHFMYTFIVGFAIVFKLPGAFMIAGLLELPTVFLSIGHIWKSLRTDLLFGVTFFVTRLGFHAYLTYTLYTSWPSLYYWIIGVAVYPLHLYWFYSYVRQQIRIRRELRRRVTAADADQPREEDLESSAEPVIQMTAIATDGVEEAPKEQADALGIGSLYYKLDNLQPSGSFKIRGMSHLIRETLAQNPNLSTIVSSSGGNAGMAAALASKTQGIPCRVFVPSTTSELVMGRLRGLGASVVVSGDVWNEANAAAMEFVEEVNRAKGPGSAKLVHPFDDVILWQGHGSLSKEILEQIAELEKTGPDAIICSVGGGGLLAGILTGLAALPEESRPYLVGVETTGAGSFAAALKEGQGLKPVRIAAITSIAKSLGSLEVAQGLLDLRTRYGADKVRSLLVSDRQALDAVVRFANDERMLVEPACGASLALGYEPDLLKEALPELGRTSVVVMVVCGGSGVTLQSIEQWDASLSMLEE